MCDCVMVIVWVYNSEDGRGKSGKGEEVGEGGVKVDESQPDVARVAAEGLAMNPS